MKQDNPTLIQATNIFQSLHEMYHDLANVLRLNINEVDYININKRIMIGQNKLNILENELSLLAGRL